VKVPQPNLNVAIVNSFIAKAGANRKLKKLWGTVTVGGEEVLNARRHYHKAAARPDNYEKLFKFLKVYDDIEDYSGEGVKSAWFTLNKSNGPEDQDIDISYFRDNLNRMWWDNTDGVMPSDLTLTTTIVIGERFDRQSGIPHIDWNASEEVITQSILDNYDSLWTTNRIVQEGVGVINKGSVDPDADILVPDLDDLSPDDPWLAVLSRNALRANGMPCTIKKVEFGLGGVAVQPMYNTAVVTIEIPYHEFTSTDPIVVSIADDSLATYDSLKISGLREAMRGLSGTGIHQDNGLITQIAAKKVTFYETVDDIDETTVSRSYLTWEDSKVGVGLFDSFWVQEGDLWYFKAGVINNPKAYGTTHTKLNKYLFSLLDTGYKKKKASFWKKLVAVVVFIIAVVITFVSVGAASPWTAQVMAASFAVIVGGLVISIVSAVFGALGMSDWSLAFSEISKTLEPLVAVASIIMVVGAFVQSGAAEAIKQYATDELNNLIYETILGEFGDLGSLLADAMDGTIDSGSLDVINKFASTYSSVQLGKIESISSRNVDLKAEYASLAEESAKETDIMKGYMNIYSKPATADWSIYASTFDLPYERGGGTLSMGNVQKTTKKALRPADYKEPMFEGILLV